MDYLCDTNIILRLAEPAHPTHGTALTASQKILTANHRLCLIPQNLIEFWNVATRAADKNGLGWTVSQTHAEVISLESIFTVLPDTPAIYVEWRKLVVAHSVTGKLVHDTRIVAAMHAHQINYLLTFNLGDFKRFASITAVDPAIV